MNATPKGRRFAVLMPARAALGLCFLFLAGGIALVLTAPHLLSAYHLEAGGRAIRLPGSPAYDPASARAHLDQAIRWSPRNAQAYRALAKLDAEEGKWPAAIAGMQHYTKLRPANPLGWVELAEVYGAIQHEIESQPRFDLLELYPRASLSGEVALSDPLLPEALWMEPTSAITYALSLPAQSMLLRFGLALTAGACPAGSRPPAEGASASGPGGGVHLEILVNGTQLFASALDGTAAAEPDRQKQQIGLAPWAGQEVTLALRVQSVSSDACARWHEPQIVDAQVLALEALNPTRQVAEAWQQAGYVAATFIGWGAQARSAQRYDEAEAWFRRAATLEPTLADGWYYLGLVYENQAQWTSALRAYQRAIAAESFGHPPGRSDPHYRQGWIYRWHLDPPRSDEALAAYEAALAADDFGSAADAADGHYLYGHALRERGAEPGLYAAEFEKAVDLDPQHSWAFVLLGLALYERDGDVQAAVSAIQKAIALDSENRWAYFHLGEIYREDGQREKAAEMYQQALQIDPNFEAAQKQREALDGQP